MEQQKNSSDERKLKFRSNILGTRKETVIWIVSITVVSFTISALLSLASATIFYDITLTAAFIVLFIITVINITADVIGVAVTAADESPFHAMASRKISGARQAIMLVRNADKVSNLCNDVIGDICGVISGLLVGYMAIRMSGSISGNADKTVPGILLAGAITALIVGGKAVSKYIALKHSNMIVYRCSSILALLNSIYKRRGSKR